MARPVYDAPHAVLPWGWKVGAYLWTKSIAAGSLLLAALGVLLGGATGGLPAWPQAPAAPLLALVFLALTTVLLVGDLKRPDRFFFLLTKGNPSSWLVIGGWILMAYGALGTLWLGAVVTGRASWLLVLALPTAALAAATAGYSAYLFGQAEGRDFWQSPLLLPHLLIAALIGGSASLLLVDAVMSAEFGARADFALVLGAALVLNAIMLLAELGGRHASLDAGRAAKLITRGHFATRFWWGVIAGGHAPADRAHRHRPRGRRAGRGPRARRAVDLGGHVDPRGAIDSAVMRWCAFSDAFVEKLRRSDRSVFRESTTCPGHTIALRLNQGGLTMPRGSRAAESPETRRARVDREPRSHARASEPWRPGKRQPVRLREMRLNPFALYPPSLADALRDFLAEGPRSSQARAAHGHQKRRRTTRKPSTAKPRRKRKP